MLTFEHLRAMVLALPDTVETTSWDARSFKVNGKVIVFWNPTHDCPVFKVPIEKRDFLIEADPETFFTTDHHRPWPLVLARPERVDAGTQICLALQLGAGQRELDGSCAYILPAHDRERHSVHAGIRHRA